jgi:hypothetical protein
MRSSATRRLHLILCFGQWARQGATKNFLPRETKDVGVIHSLNSVNFKLNASISCFTSNRGTGIIVRFQS